MCNTDSDQVDISHSSPPPPHVPRSLPPNLHRTPANLESLATRNLDVGSSLQELLDGHDDGKLFTKINSTSDHQDHSNKWKSQVIRIYFQNVNGLRTYDGDADILDSFYQMENIRADIFGFAETKLDCHHPKVRSLIHQAKGKIWEHSKITTSSSTCSWNSLHKPGGTLLGVTGPLVGRVRETITDPLGRWTGVELLGRDGRNIIVICAYQVCQKYSSTGQLTAYHQQVSLLRQQGIARPNPRLQFVQDLKALLSRYHKSSSDIILMGDFNEVIGLKIDGMESVIRAAHLTDVQVYCHGLENEQSTYSRGPNRVDYFFVSERLLPHVIRQGCEPFNARIFSDHRGLFMDISYPGFFDRAPNVLAPLTRRHLIYNCVRHVRKYLEYMEKYLYDHNMIERASQMLELPRDDAYAVAYDTDFTRGLLAADDHCRNFRRSPWSRRLHEAMTTKFIYLRQLSQLRTGRDMTAKIQRLQSILPEPVPVSPSLTQTRKDLRDSQRACRQVVVQARDLAKSFQEERIQAKQLANPDLDPEDIAKQIRQREALRDMWRRIPSTKSKRSGGLSMIKVPTDPAADPKHPDTTFRTIVDPVEMESALLTRNKKHFSQAKDTPLASDAISTSLGWGANTPTSQSILDGTADIASLTDNPQAAWILQYCKRQLQEQGHEITFDEFQQCYLNWNVGTSTSPSGRHLSHHHALFQPHSLPGDTALDTKLFTETKLSMWHAHYACIAYATRHGFCFPRWYQVVNAMIEKEPGNPLLHRLRVIHLYENDYNLILGIKFRQVVQRAHDSKLLHAGCYGGLPNKQSVDPIFLELMQYDYASLTRYDTIKFANDAGSCYDRIIASPSNVLARAMGLHSNIASIHGDMLEHATYRIKTCLGISTASYCHSCDSPVYGTGQGSCSSPLIWCLNCSVYFRIFDDHCYGAFFQDPTGDIVLQMGMAGYVDDNGIVVNCHPAQRRTLISKAAHDAQLWSDILWASGGILEHDKCSYHYLLTDFDRQGAPILRAGIHGRPICVRDAKGRSTQLKQLSAYVSYKTLGTFQAPGSRQVAQAQALRTRSQKLIRILATSTCQGPSAWMFYSSVYCKSVGYPLTVSRLDIKKLTEIQRPMIPLLLNRLGYDRTLAHALVFGPRTLGGLGVTHIHTTKMHSQLSLVIRTLRTEGQPNTLFVINLNRIQHTSGIGEPIFLYPHVRLPHLEGTWLIHLRKTLSTLGAALEIADIRILPRQRDHDSYLMEVALASRIFTDQELRYINYCRFYLQCLHLSDICTAGGDSLAPGVYAGIRSSQLSISKYSEPYQENPGPLAWAAWRKLLRQVANSKGHLYQPLGTWHFPPATLQRRWKFLYSPSLNLLYKWRLDTYVVLRPVRNRIFSFGFKLKTMDLPSDSTPIDCDITTDGWRIRSVKGQSIYDDSPPSSPTFEEFLDTCRPHIRCQLLRFDLLGHTIEGMVSAIARARRYLLVTDGGAARKCGSYGWTLGLPDGHRLAKGSGSVFGYDPSSYRSEISGCRAGLLFILLAFEFCKQPLPTNLLEFYCDNLGFIQKIGKLREYPSAIDACCLDAEWDLFSSAHGLFQTFPVLPQVLHVKGHQDRERPYYELSLPAQMNVDSDKLATRELDEYGDIHPLVPFNPLTKVALHIEGRTVTRDLEQAIQNRLFARPLRNYFCDRFQWTRETHESIDWPLFSGVYSAYPRSRKFFYQFSWKRLPCGARLHRRSTRYDDRCPLCFAPQESDDHLVQCPHQHRTQWRTSFFDGLEKHLSPFLDPELFDMICLGLKKYFVFDPSISTRFPDPPTLPFLPPIDVPASVSQEVLQDLTDTDSVVHTGDSFYNSSVPLSWPASDPDLRATPTPQPQPPPTPSPPSVPPLPSLDTSSSSPSVSLPIPATICPSSVPLPERFHFSSDSASTDTASARVSSPPAPSESPSSPSVIRCSSTASDLDSTDPDYDIHDDDFTSTYLRTSQTSDDPYIQLRQSQDAIGWDHFFRGKLSPDWAHLQYIYACRHNKLEPSKYWTTWLIKYMASQAHNLWLSRNRDRHGHDSAEQYQAKLTQVRRDVTDMYSHLDHVLPDDRELFGASLESHLTQPLSQLQSWLMVNKPLILMSVRQAKDKSLAKTPPLTRFFKTDPKSRSQNSRARSAKPLKQYRASRMTQFATSILQRRSTLPKPNPDPPDPLSSSPPPSPPPRPIQRYLFDFFPNHPG
jgi:exonuclease III